MISFMQIESHHARCKKQWGSCNVKKVCLHSVPCARHSVNIKHIPSVGGGTMERALHKFFEFWIFRLHQLHVFICLKSASAGAACRLTESFSLFICSFICLFVCLSFYFCVTVVCVRIEKRRTHQSTMVPEHTHTHTHTRSVVDPLENCENQIRSVSARYYTHRRHLFVFYRKRLSFALLTRTPLSVLEKWKTG